MKKFLLSTLTLVALVVTLFFSLKTPMQALTFALPVVLFAVLWVFWLLGKFEGKRELAWWVMVLPTVAVYACMGWLLFTGKWMYHIQLNGVEVDLRDGQNKERALMLGEVADKDEMVKAPLFRVKDFPVDALQLKADGNGLRVLPGPGYEPGLLVFSEKKLLAIKKEKDGMYPQVVRLEDGDEIVVGTTAGGGTRKVLNLGEGMGAINPAQNNTVGGYRVVGNRGEYAARIEGYGDEALLLKLIEKGKFLIVKRGPSLDAGVKVRVNGAELNFHQSEAFKLGYLGGRMRIELMRMDPLAGSYVYRESGVSTGDSVALTQKLEDLKARGAIRFSVPAVAEKGVTAGGGAEDGWTLKGLEAEAYEMLFEDGELVLSASSGRGGSKGVDPLTRNALRDYRVKEGETVQFGDETSPWGGKLTFVKLEEKEISAENTADAEGTTRVESGEKRVVLSFVSNRERGSGEIVLPILPREVELPVVGTKVSLPARLPWNSKVYPLSNIGSGTSSIKSAVVYGFPGTGEGYGDRVTKQNPSLLILEPGVKVMRAGKRVLAVNTDGKIKETRSNIVKNGADLEFRKLMVKEFETYPVDVVSLEGSGQAAELRYFGGISLSRKLSKIGVRENKAQGKFELVIKLAKPLIRSVPYAVLEDDLERKQEEGVTEQEYPSIGVNQAGQLSVLDNQVEFPWLTGWFDRAVGQLDLQGGSFQVRDYYSKREMDYGTDFTIGGMDRLNMQVRSLQIPWRLLFILGLAFIVTIGITLLRGYSMAWVSLYFVVAYLTCARLLFARSVWLNPPFGEDKLRDASWAVVLMPLAVFLLSGLLYLICNKWKFWQMKQDKVVARKRPYLWVLIWAVALLVIRVGLLAMGMKEGANFGVRFAFSIVYVPFFLLLFGTGCSIALVRLKATTGLSKEKELWKFLWFSFCMFLIQAFIGAIVSDIGSFLYLVPQVLVLSLIGLVYFKQSRKQRVNQWKRWGLIVATVIPILATVVFLKYPKLPVSMLAGDLLSSKGLKQVETNATKLRVVNFADPEVLENMGTDAAELILQDHQLMENYSRRGWAGEGYLNVNVVKAKYETALNDNVSAVYIFGQFGIFGACAVVLCYVILVIGAMQPHWNPLALTSILAGIVFAFTSIYMVGANWGFMPFTGRNLYCLGLNSISDLVESLCLLTLVGAMHWALPVRLPFFKRSRQKKMKRGEAEDGDVVDV